MSDFNYNHLKSFIFVARYKNYSMAAKQLGKGRSTISEHIEAFEEELGQPLFEKQSRSVELTSLGKKIYRHSVLLSRQIAAWEELVSQATDLQHSTLLRIAYTDVVPKSSLLCAMSKLLEQGIRLELIETEQATAIQMLEKNQVDLALSPTITIKDEPDFDADRKLIGNMPFRFYAHKEFFSQQPVNITELVSHTQVLPRAYSNKYVDRHLIFTTNNISITDIELLKEALRQKTGWAFLPKHLCAESWPDIIEVITELGREGYVTPIEARWRSGEYTLIEQALEIVENCIGHESINWLVDRPFIQE